jgi:hypothetical protein
LAHFSARTAPWTAGRAGRLSQEGAASSSYPSSTWPELAFPQGTQFVGVSESGYGYDYHAAPVTKTVNGHKVVQFKQHCGDTALNGDGQLSRDRNIFGSH